MITDSFEMRDNRVVFTFSVGSAGVIKVQQSLDNIDFVDTNVELDTESGPCGINFEGKKGLFIRLDSTIDLVNLKILN